MLMAEARGLEWQVCVCNLPSSTTCGRSVENIFFVLPVSEYLASFGITILSSWYVAAIVALVLGLLFVGMLLTCRIYCSLDLLIFLQDPCGAGSCRGAQERAHSQGQVAQCRSVLEHQTAQGGRRPARKVPPANPTQILFYPGIRGSVYPNPSRTRGHGIAPRRGTQRKRPQKGNSVTRIAHVTGRSIWCIYRNMQQTPCAFILPCGEDIFWRRYLSRCAIVTQFYSNFKTLAHALTGSRVSVKTYRVSIQP
jgi:hypothetical protein